MRGEAPQGQKSIFLLLCVAEQYRGAGELCETEGLKKIDKTIYHIHTNIPLPVCASGNTAVRRATTLGATSVVALLAGTDKKITHLHIHCL